MADGNLISWSQATWNPLHHWDDGATSVLLGAKLAGRHLDGLLHDAYPEVE